jgi:hypothetical protein
MRTRPPECSHNNNNVTLITSQPQRRPLTKKSLTGTSTEMLCPVPVALGPGMPVPNPWLLGLLGPWLGEERDEPAAPV